MPKKETHTTEGAKLYELGFHIIPTVTDQKVAAAFSRVKDSIISINGEIIKEGEAKHIKLAYTIVKKIDSKNQKFNSAHFAWIKFNAKSADIEDLKKTLDGDSEILRYIILKTVDDYDHSTNKIADEMQAEQESGSESESESETESAQPEKTDEAETEKDSEDTDNDEAKESTEDEIDQAIDELTEAK